MNSEFFYKNFIPFLLLCFNAPGVFAQKENKIASQALAPATALDSVLLANDCKNRRNALSDKLKSGLLIMHCNQNTHDNFFYLTGWKEESAYAIVDLSKQDLKLFVPTSSPHAIIWDGQQPGLNEARKLGATAYPFLAFKNYLNNIPANENVFVLSQDKIIPGNLKKFEPGKIVFIDTLINEMRVNKSDLEVEYIRKAIGITATALNNAFKNTRPNMYEYEIEALFDYEYTRNGIREAFKSICGSGINSTILHYDTNSKLMEEGEVLLMDVGAEFNGYAADISRTIPVSGKFTKSQLELYNLVLHAQQEGIKLLKPGYRLLDFHNKCSQIITGGLFKLGLIADTTKAWQKNVFILYRSGHYLGLNVHDVGRYEDIHQKNNPGLRFLLPGMVITIEPGIYINPQMLNLIYEIHGGKVPKAELDEFVEKVTPAFKKYANTGIRIEDDILITAEGNEILSDAVPKQPEAIERLMTKK